MNVEIRIKEVENKKDYYDMTIKTYKSRIDGRFERSELRHIIETIDNII